MTVRAKYLGLFFISVSMTLLSDIPQHVGSAHLFAKYLLFSLLILSTILKVEIGLKLLIILAFCGRDISSNASFLDLQAASIWQSNIGPVNPSWVIFTVLLILLIRVGIYANFKFFNNKILFWNTIFFASIPVLTGLFYGNFGPDGLADEVVKDAKLPLMLFVTFCLYGTMLKVKPASIQSFAEIVLISLFARHSVDFIYLLMNEGAQLASGITRVSEDSAKGAIAFIVYFGVLLFSTSKFRISGVLIASIAFSLLIAYGTRFLWLTFLLGLPLAAIILGGKNSIKACLILVAIAFGGLSILTIVQPDTRDLVLLRAKTITEGRNFDRFAVNTEYNILSRIDPIRYGQIVNIIDHAKENQSHILGLGYGGYYNADVIAFDVNLRDTFRRYSLETGKFFTAHGYIQLVYLKYGLIGLICLTAFWVKPINHAIRQVPELTRHSWSLGTYSIIAMIPFCVTGMLALYWSGKGLFVNGVVLAVLTASATKQWKFAKSSTTT